MNYTFSILGKCKTSAKSLLTFLSRTLILYRLCVYLCIFIEPPVKIQIEAVEKDVDFETNSEKRSRKLFDSITKPQILSNLINNVLNLHACTLLWVETGSLNFYVQCESAEALENLRQSINDGTFAEQLEDVLITESVLDDEDVSCLHIETTMDDREHQEAYQKYVEMGKKLSYHWFRIIIFPVHCN